MRVYGDFCTAAPLKTLFHSHTLSSVDDLSSSSAGKALIVSSDVTQALTV